LQFGKNLVRDRTVFEEVDGFGTDA